MRRRRERMEQEADKGGESEWIRCNCPALGGWRRSMENGQGGGWRRRIGVWRRWRCTKEDEMEDGERGIWRGRIEEDGVREGV